MREKWIAGQRFNIGDVRVIRQRFSAWQWIKSLFKAEGRRQKAEGQEAPLDVTNVIPFTSSIEQQWPDGRVWEVYLASGYRFTTDAAGFREIERELQIVEETMRVLGMVSNMQEFSKYR